MLSEVSSIPITVIGLRATRLNSLPYPQNSMCSIHYMNLV